jgi:hypothetical protein
VKEEANSLIFSSLPLDGAASNNDTIGPDSGSDYFVVIRYLESSPVVLKVEPPEIHPDIEILSAYYSDGKYIWDNLEYTTIRNGGLRFRHQLVERAKEAFGVCGPLSEEVLHSAGLSAFEIFLHTTSAPLA